MKAQPFYEGPEELLGQMDVETLLKMTYHCDSIALSPLMISCGDSPICRVMLRQPGVRQNSTYRSAFILPANNWVQASMTDEPLETFRLRRFTENMSDVVKKIPTIPPVNHLPNRWRVVKNTFDRLICIVAPMERTGDFGVNDSFYASTKRLYIGGGYPAVKL